MRQFTYTLTYFTFNPEEIKHTKAILLTNGLLATDNAKTAHGLIGECNRYEIAGIGGIAGAFELANIAQTSQY